FDGEPLGRIHPDLGQHLEMGGVLEVGLGPHRDRLDARATGRAKLLLAHRLREGAAHQVAQNLGTHLVAELLGDDRERGLAGAKTLEACGARQTFQALLHLARHLGGRYGHFQTPREATRVGERDLHQSNPRRRRSFKPRSLKTAFRDVKRRENWCERRDSNSHGFPHWILSPARLPVPPLSPVPCAPETSRMRLHLTAVRRGARDYSRWSAASCAAPSLVIVAGSVL